MPMLRATLCYTLLAPLVLVASLQAADEPEPEITVTPIVKPERSTPVDFEGEVLPILRQNCLACHSAAAAESDLSLETPAAILQGGYSGPAVDIESAAESLLLLYASGESEPLMPPADNRVDARRLTSEELGLIQLWIEQGAQGEVSAAAEAMNWQPLPEGVNPIYAVALTEDGQFAACGRANQIFIYHLPTGRTIDRLTDPALLHADLYQQPGVAHRDLVQSLAFSPDGYTLASGGYRVVKLWQRPRNVRLQDLAVAENGVTSSALSPDGAWLATAGADHQIRLWRLENGEPGAVLSGHSDVVRGLRFNADGTRLASASQDATLRLWNVPEGQPLGRVDTPSPLADVEWTADGAQLVTAGVDHRVRTWAVPPSSAAPTLDSDEPLTAYVTGAEQLAAWSTESGAVIVRDPGSADAPRILRTSGAAVAELTLSANRSRLAVREQDGGVALYDISSGETVGNYPPSPDAYTTALPLDSDTLLLGDSQGQLVAWRAAAERTRQLEPIGDAPPTLLVVSPDGRWMASDTTLDGQPVVIVREYATRDIVARLAGHTSALLDIAFNSDGTQILSTSADGSVRLWDVASGSPLHTLSEHASLPQHATFVGPDQFATAHADGRVRLWRVADASEVRTLEDLADHDLLTLRATTDGQLLGAATRQGALRIWSIADGALQTSLDTARATEMAAWAPALDRAVFVDSDRQLSIVSRDGTTIAAPSMATAPIRSLAVTADGTRAVVGSLDRQLAVIDLATGRTIERFQSSGDLAALDIVPEADELLVATTDRRVHSHALRAQRLVFASPAPVTVSIAGAEPGSVIVGTEDGQVAAVDVANRQTTPWGKLESPITALALNSDASLLAIAAKDGTLHVWRANDHQPALPAPLAGLGQSAAWLEFATDNRFLFAAARTGPVLAWDVAHGELVERYVPAGETLLGLHADGDRMLIAAGQTVQPWTVSAKSIWSGHTAPVTSLARLPDGVHLLSGSEDGTARQWELASGGEVRQFDHGGPVTDVAVRPDGQRLATAGANHTVRLWNAADAAQVAEIKGDYTAQLELVRREKAEARLKADLDAATKSVADGETDLVAKNEAVKTATEAQATAAQAMADTAAAAQTAEAAKTEAVQLAMAAAETAKSTAEAKTAADARAAQTAEIAMLTASSATQTQNTVAAAQQSVDAAQAALQNLSAALEKAPEDQTLIDAKARVEQAAAESQRALAALQPTLEAAQALSATKATESQSAATEQAQATEKAAQAEAASKEAAEKQAAAEKAATDAAAAAKAAADKHADAEKATRAAENAVKSATASLERNQASVIDVTQRHEQATLVLTAARETAAQHERPVRSLAFSPDNRYLVTAGDDPLVHEYLADDGQPQETYAGHSQPVSSLHYTPQGQLLSAAGDGSAKLWQRLGPWQLAGQLGPANDAPLDVAASPLIDRALAVAFSPDGRYLAVGGGEPSRSGQLQIWDLESRTLAREIAEAHSDTVFGVAFSPDGRYLASCAADKFVKVFDAASGEEVRSFEGHTHHVLGVSWNADGKTLASGGADQVIKLWSFETGEQQRTIGGFGKQVTSVTFVGETGTTISSSGDQTVRLHTVGDGKNTRNFGGGTDFMNSATTTPDGRLVVAGGQDSVLRTWNGTDGKAQQSFEPPAADNEQAQR